MKIGLFDIKTTGEKYLINAGTNGLEINGNTQQTKKFKNYSKQKHIPLFQTDLGKKFIFNRFENNRCVVAGDVLEKYVAEYEELAVD